MGVMPLANDAVESNGQADMHEVWNEPNRLERTSAHNGALQPPSCTGAHSQLSEHTSGAQTQEKQQKEMER